MFKRLILVFPYFILEKKCWGCALLQKLISVKKYKLHIYMTDRDCTLFRSLFLTKFRQFFFLFLDSKLIVFVISENIFSGMIALFCYIYSEKNSH